MVNNGLNAHKDSYVWTNNDKRMVEIFIVIRADGAGSSLSGASPRLSGADPSPIEHPVTHFPHKNAL